MSVVRDDAELRLLTRLGDRDPRARQLALIELDEDRRGDGAAELLLHAIQSSDPRVRRNVIAPRSGKRR